MHKLSLWAAWLPAFFCVTAAADPRLINAYVVNEGSASLSIIDTPTEKVTATVNVGERPRGLAVSSEGERAYVSLEDGTLVERDMFSRIESARATLGGLPYSIDLSPDGKLIAAAVQNSAEVVLMDLATMRTVKKIPIRSGKQPTNAVFSPDGRWIYVRTEDGPALDVADVRQGTVATSITVGPRLRDIAFTADGSRAYVTAEQGSEVAVIDVLRHTVLARMKTSSAPFGMALHPDGKRVFVSAPGAGKIYVLDTGSNKIVAEVDACSGASRMALTPGGDKLYVTCGPANEVAVIDTTTSRRVAQIAVGVTPAHIAIREANTQSEEAERWERKPKRP